MVLFLVAIAVAALLRPRTLETNPGAPEATTGQSMTSAGAPPPVEGAVPPEASSGSPAGALNGSVEVKPATLTEPSAAKTPASAAPARALGIYRLHPFVRGRPRRPGRGLDPPLDCRCAATQGRIAKRASASLRAFVRLLRAGACGHAPIGSDRAIFSLAASGVRAVCQGRLAIVC